MKENKFYLPGSGLLREKMKVISTFQLWARCCLHVLSMKVGCKMNESNGYFHVTIQKHRGNIWKHPETSGNAPIQLMSLFPFTARWWVWLSHNKQLTADRQALHSVDCQSLHDNCMTSICDFLSRFCSNLSQKFDYSGLGWRPINTKIILDYALYHSNFVPKFSSYITQNCSYKTWTTHKQDTQTHIVRSDIALYV